MMDLIKIGENIARLRRMNNLTQEKLAEKLQITAPAVSRWENGRALPDISLLPELAEIFDCTIDHLLMVERKQNDNQKHDAEHIHNDLNQSAFDMSSISNLANQIIQIVEGKNMIGMSNQSIINAFSEKHGHMGDVTVIRNRTTRSEKYLISSITVKVNDREYHLIEKMLFGDMTELYRTKLLSEYGISIPLIYKIDFEEKNILLEDLSEDYISGREFDEKTCNGDIYRKSYDQIIDAAAQFHLSFWDKTEAFQMIGLPWHVENEHNLKVHIEGMRRDLDTFLHLFPNTMSPYETQCFMDALAILHKEMPHVMESRFHKGKNLTIIHGDLNPSNVFIAKEDNSNVKFIDMEAVRMGLPTEDLAMFLALHVAPDKAVIPYLGRYYLELCKNVEHYSINDFLNDYREAVLMTMFHPIGIVGVQMKICDERMIKRAIKAYELVTRDFNVLQSQITEEIRTRLSHSTEPDSCSELQ